MKFHTKLFLFLFFLFSHYIASSTVSGNETDTLLSIKSYLIDPLNQLGDWNISNSLHCNWTGVQCNSMGEVEILDLSHMNLTGNISDQIQSLNSLTTLNLCGNGFSMPLPRLLSNLTSLKFLDVSQNYFTDNFPIGFGKIMGLIELNASSNSFTGEIPDDIGNLTMLESLDIRGSFFEGSFPKTFGNLKKLKFLGLAGNNLSGTLPPEMGQMSSLETLIIGYNNLEGEIPKEIGNLTNLEYLDLAIGNLGGAIPSEIGNLKNLNTVLMYKNVLQNEIPPEIGNLISLQILDLSDNMLSGKIPNGISGLKNLQFLNLLCNNLSGTVPSGLSELTQLEVLELWNNSLSGPLPSELGKNSPLQWVDVSSNNLSGPIPPTLCSKGNLTKLILFNNLFSDQIPTGISTCSSLVRVRMQNNLFSGTIPPGFGKLGKLQRLELAKNNLTGPIPSDLAGSTSISFLDFSYNHLQSSLSSSLLSIPNLQTFMASDNNLVGEIPDHFQDCPSLAVLDLSSNHFTGTIPTSIASCEKLVTLDLHNNQLTGEIPIALSMMHTLSVLDLSNNSLTGGIPKTFGNSPALEMLNVSYNKLEGVVPENGMLRTISPNDLIGNAGLCGGVLPPCPHNAYVSNQRGLHIKHVIAGWAVGISTLLAIVALVFGGMFLYKRWYSNGSCFEERLEMGRGEWPWRLMAFQRLNFTSNEVLACIKEANVIGMGATGVVYKADVARSSTIVAVKKLWRTQTDIELGGSDDLVGEVNLLGKLRHRNIVRLLGFLHNDRDAMIIYEYMINGSLGEALHGKEGGRLLVDWVSRYNIAVGVAQGLAYLHHDCHPPIIHRDIKSNNILLDGNLDARVADFGLARMMIKKDETVSMVAGSYGYIAPEYGYTLKVDEKSDIYSYGVVLLELLTGKRPLEPEFGESVDINEWIRKKIRENRSLEEALDPNVGSCNKHVQEEMLLVLRIALLCTAKQPKDRPSMRDVITMLGEAKPRRKSSSASTVNTVDKDTPIFTTSPVNGLV